MNNNPGTMFRRLFGPMLIYWLISFAGQFIAEIAVLYPNISDMAASVLATGNATEQELTKAFMDYAGTVMEVAMKYQTQILTVGAICTIPMTVYLFMKDRKMERQFNLPTNKKADGREYIKIVGLGIAACIGLNCLMFMTNIAVLSVDYQNTSDALYSAGFVTELICLGMIVPFSEELIFRGVIFKRFRQNASFMRAAVFSTLLFSLTHGNIVQVIYTLVIGMFLAYVYEKFGSFKAPVLLHMVINITSIVVTELGGFDWMLADIFRMAVITVVCAFAGSVMYVAIQRIDEKPDLPEPPENHNTPDMY